MDAPMGLYDKRIKPQLFNKYYSPLLHDKVNVPMYDPLAVKPYDMLTEQEKEERLKKYGNSGFPEKNAGIKVPEEIKQTVEKPDSFMMLDGKKYSYEELIKNFPNMKNDSVFKANFPGRERPKTKE